MTPQQGGYKAELAAWLRTTWSERRPLLSLEEIIAVAVEALDVSLEDLTGPDQSPELIAKRRLLVIAARSHGHEMGEIREALNCPSLGALTGVRFPRNEQLWGR